jgi:hypothetical protein
LVHDIEAEEAGFAYSSPEAEVRLRKQARRGAVWGGERMATGHRDERNEHAEQRFLGVLGALGG